MNELFEGLKSTKDIEAPEVDFDIYESYGHWLYDRSAWFSSLDKGDERWRYGRREALLAEKHFGREGLMEAVCKIALDGKTPSTAPDFIKSIASKVDPDYGFTSLKAYRMYLDYMIEHSRGLE